MKGSYIFFILFVISLKGNHSKQIKNANKQSLQKMNMENHIMYVSQNPQPKHLP